MKKELEHRCAWCGGAIPPTRGPGRPRRYCRASHRQRHYEARRLATSRGLQADDVLVTRPGLERWLDARYVLETVLEDIGRDLSRRPTSSELRAAQAQLERAARLVLATDLEIRAVGST